MPFRPLFASPFRLPFSPPRFCSIRPIRFFGIFMGFLVIGTYVMVLTVYAAGAAYHRKSKRAQGKERASPMSLVARAQKARKRRQSKSELEEEEETAAAGSEGFVVPPPPSSTPPPLLDEGEEKEQDIVAVIPLYVSTFPSFDWESNQNSV